MPKGVNIMKIDKEILVCYKNINDRLSSEEISCLKIHGKALTKKYKDLIVKVETKKQPGF